MNLRTVGITLLFIIVSVVTVMAQDNELPDDDLFELGLEVYQSNGCTSCHGLEGEGSVVAPPLANSSEAVIRRQIRAPLGIMPNYTPEEISSEELDALVVYLLELEPFDFTEFKGERLQEELGEEIVMRHWMALIALEVEDLEVAHEHIEFILEYVEDEHAEYMEEVLLLIDDEEIHEAQHILQGMIADVSGFEGAEGIVHLQILLSAIRTQDYEEAIHEFEHYLESDGYDDAIGITIEALLEAEQYDALEIVLSEYLADVEIIIDDEKYDDIHDDEHDDEEHDHD